MGKSTLDKFRATGRNTARLLALLVVLVLNGCSFLTPKTEPAEGPEVVVTPDVVVTPEVVATPKIVTTPVEPQSVEPLRLPPVAIVITSSQPAFLDVANALAEHLEDFTVVDLSQSSRPPATVLRSINDSDAGTVVAIGLRAAQASVAIADSPVIFSQVFNHQDHGLLTSNSRGVAPLAPLAAQLAAWTKFDPTISRIGIIIGEGHDALIAEAKTAAAESNVKLLIRIAHSDQETLYIFRRMVHEIDGFWLFPDNRILSARSLQEILSTANRRQVAVAVPNESMLKMGASISLATQAEDIAATIARLILKIQADGLQSIPAISPLSAIQVVTRDGVKVAIR